MKKSNMLSPPLLSRVYLNKFTLLICLIFSIFFGCKKDTIETPPEPEPQPILDYRDSFVGTYSGFYVNYSLSWNPPPPVVYHYSEGPATNYTINISKLAGQGNDSLIYSNEILKVLPYATSMSNDTFLIRSSGLYIFGYSLGQSGRVQFFGDSLKTYCESLEGAMSSFTYGRKFRGRK